MRKLTIVLSALAMFAFVAPASADSLFEKCKRQKESIETMKTDAGKMGVRIKTIDQEMIELARQLRALRKEKTAKNRDMLRLNKKIRQQEALQQRRCRGLQRCEAMEKKVAALQDRMTPLSKTLATIREGIRTRRTEIGALNTDIKRMENQFAQLGCDNLQIGQTEQSTFDKCSALSKDWNAVQNRINQLQASIQRLRNSYQAVMKKVRTLGAELARLSKKMRRTCSHSSRLAEIEVMEKEQSDSRLLQEELDAMDKDVRKFKMMKLIKAKPKGSGKPTLKEKKKGPKDDEKGKRKKRRRMLKPAR